MDFFSVVKYKRVEDSGLGTMMQKLSWHSVVKKSSRFNQRITQFTGLVSQVQAVFGTIITIRIIIMITITIIIIIIIIMTITINHITITITIIITTTITIIVIIIIIIIIIIKS